MNRDCRELDKEAELLFFWDGDSVFSALDSSYLSSEGKVHSSYFQSPYSDLGPDHVLQ